MESKFKIGTKMHISQGQHASNTGFIESKVFRTEDDTRPQYRVMTEDGNSVVVPEKYMYPLHHVKGDGTMGDVIMREDEPNGEIRITEAALEYLLSLPDTFFESTDGYNGLPLAQNQIDWIIKTIVRPANSKTIRGRRPSDVDPVNLSNYKIGKHATLRGRERIEPNPEATKRKVWDSVRIQARLFINSAAMVIEQEMDDPDKPGVVLMANVYVSATGNVVLSISSDKVVTIYTVEEFGKVVGTEYIPATMEAIEQCKEKNRNSRKET